MHAHQRFLLVPSSGAFRTPHVSTNQRNPRPARVASARAPPLAGATRGAPCHRSADRHARPRYSQWRAARRSRWLREHSGIQPGRQDAGVGQLLRRGTGPTRRWNAGHRDQQRHSQQRPGSSAEVVHATSAGFGHSVYAGWGPVWNLADVALAVYMVLATWALARRSHAGKSVEGSQIVGFTSTRKPGRTGATRPRLRGRAAVDQSRATPS
jgi:hypothetical protein